MPRSLRAASRASTKPRAPRRNAIDTRVEPASLTRFVADLGGVWPASREPDTRLGLAVSGGPDSLALLILAAKALPGRCEVATIDHGLRSEASSETAMVSRLCGELGVACAVLPVMVAPGNVQDAARNARYAALGAWAATRGLDAVATAHHADDQAETLVMRLNRGSGLAGLAGIRAARLMADDRILLVRPLLGWRKAELETVAAQAGLSPVRDPSNHDPRFERARLRAALAGHDLLAVGALAASAGHLAEAAEALEWACDRAWERAIGEAEGWRWKGTDEPLAILAGVIARGIAAAGGKSVDIGEAVRLVKRIGDGSGGNLGGVLVSRSGPIWHFAPEPSRRG